MESVTEIVSFSHDGIRRMWYPFSAKLDSNSTIISAENFYEIGELMMLIKSMFATNNHSPEMVSKPNIDGARKFIVGENTRRIECSVVFKTGKSQYFLQRCFFGNYSIEAKLQKVGSTVTYNDDEVIKMLSKFHKPFVIGDETLFGNGSMILKPDSDFTRSSLVALCNSWARMVGIHDSNLEVDHAGRWSATENQDGIFSKRSRRRVKLTSPLPTLIHLAQAVIRKRKFGICPPVFSPLNVERLNQFETIAFLDLIRNVCKEESLQFIVGVNSKPEVNSIIDVISTPKLSIYSNF